MSQSGLTTSLLDVNDTATHDDLHLQLLQHLQNQQPPEFNANFNNHVLGDGQAGCSLVQDILYSHNCTWAILHHKFQLSACFVNRCSSLAGR